MDTAGNDSDLIRKIAEIFIEKTRAMGKEDVLRTTAQQDHRQIVLLLRRYPVVMAMLVVQAMRSLHKTDCDLSFPAAWEEIAVVIKSHYVN